MIDNTPEENEKKDPIKKILEEAGFVVLPLEQIQAILEEMESQIMHETDINNREELEFYLNKLEELVGEEEAQTLDLEQVIKWLKALKSV